MNRLFFNFAKRKKTFLRSWYDNKVHFIFQMKIPANILLKHHLKTPQKLASSYDRKTHLQNPDRAQGEDFLSPLVREKKSYSSF